MRKFLTLLLSIVVCGAAIAALSTQEKSVKKVKATAELQQLKRIGSGAEKNAIPMEYKGVKANTAKKVKAMAAAPKADLEGTWECSYTGMLNSNSGKHECEATFEWENTYDQFEITIADCTIAPFYAYYEESTGKLTFEVEYFGTAGSNYVFGGPITTSGSFVSSATATFDPSTKTIQFDNSSIGLAFAACNSTNPNDIAGYYWAANGFTFTQPDGDYTLKAEFLQECTPNNEFQLQVTAGTDITDIYLVPWDGDISASEFADYYESYIPMLGQNAAAGTYKLTPEDEMEASGYYTVMAFGYDQSGNLVKKTQDCVFVVKNEDADYQNIGKILFNDQLVNGYYNNFTNVADVEIQENIHTPGVYRLVDVYDGQTAMHTNNCPHFIYLDASDPEFVNIPASNTGLDFGDGMLVYGTMGGALGYTKEQCKQMGYAVGTLSGRTITFPVRSVLAHEKRYNEPGSWSYMNQNNVMTLTLPDLLLNVYVMAGEAPFEGVTVNVEDAEGNVVEGNYVTSAGGNVEIYLPETIDYLATVKVTVTSEDGQTQSADVKLNGATNVYSFTLEAPAVTPEVPEIPEGAVIVYNDGDILEGLTQEYWWNCDPNSVNFHAQNPLGGENEVLKFSAANISGYSDASMGLLAHDSMITGPLHSATLNFNYYKVGAGTYTVRLTGGNGPTNADNEYNYELGSEDGISTQADGWTTVSIDIAEKWPKLAQAWDDDVNEGLAYVFSIIVSGGEENSAIYFDQVYYTNVDESWEAPVHVVIAPETVPVPTHDPENVLSVFSSAYEPGVSFAPQQWGSPTQFENKVIDNATVEYLKSFTYLGWEFLPAETINVDLTDYDYMHVDFWTPTEGAGFAFTPITREGTVKESSQKQTVKIEEWNSYDIPLSTWSDLGMDLSTVFQIKYDQGISEEGYIANVYFWKEASEEPEVPDYDVPALVLDDFEIDYVADNTGNATVANVPVNLMLEKGETLTYMGFQFDLTLPEGVEPTAAVDFNSKEISFKEYDEDTNVWRFVAYMEDNDGAGYTVTDDIALISFSAPYSALERESYPWEETLVISNVRFSDPLGNDIKGFYDSESIMTIVDKTVHTTDLTLKSVSFAGPSYTTVAPVDMISEATEGEDLEVVLYVAPTNTTDQMEVAVNNEKVTVELQGTPAEEEVDGENLLVYTYLVDTSALGLTVGQTTDVTVTFTSGDETADFTVTVYGVRLGDSNFSHQVTVADVVTTANFIVDAPSTRFDYPNANVVTGDEDVDGAVDGISVQDITATIDIILNPDNDNSIRGVRRNVRNILTNDVLTAADFSVKAGAPFSIPVYLDNSYEYAALSAVVEIPEGMTVNNVTLGARAAGHNYVYNMVDGKLHVVIYSQSNASFADVEGSLFNIEVIADENCGNITIGSILASDARSNGYTLGFTGGENQTGTTGINGIDADNDGVRYFTVDGIEVFNPEKGQILIRVEGDKAVKVVF